MTRIIGWRRGSPRHHGRAVLAAVAAVAVLGGATGLAGAVSGGIGTPVEAAAAEPSSPAPGTGAPAAASAQSAGPESGVSGPGPNTGPSAAGSAAAPAPGAAGRHGPGSDGLDSAPLTFGQRFTWASGVAVEVAKPLPFAPSRTATGQTTGRVVAVRTTVVNGGKAPFTLDVFVFGPEASFGGVEATKVVDRARGTGNLTKVVVAPGKSFTYVTALTIGPGSGLLELDFTEAIGDDDPAVFVGKV